MSATRIAVVGMGCVYPDATSPDALWENVLARRRAFRRMPRERLDAADYFSPDRAAPDRTYSLQAAVIDGWTFDRVAYRVAGPTYRSADLAHWLALDVAATALADAGFAGGDGLPRDATGVLVGNSLTGEFSRASVMRLRWPYVRHVVERDLEREGWTPARRAAFLDRLEARYKSPFEPVGEETLAGGLSNTIAGRICNTFDLHGGGYTVDGACSSSLLSIVHAAGALVSRDLDVALAGGVDLSLDPFELVGFAKTGALADEEMRVYDARSGGFWPGEGCGIVVLMRLEDARREGKRVLATLAGWGISSDGAGGITRPEPEGQRLALDRAYRRAGYGPDSVEYFEGHGTGTAVGDATELRVLTDARRAAGATRPATLGSIKANIGHTKAAAGVAGFIKAVKALDAAVLPPTTGVTSPNPILLEPARARVLRVSDDGDTWHARPRRAAVSAMGFGGINAHLTLESDVPARTPSPRTRALLASSQDTELFLVGARDVDHLDERFAAIEQAAPRLARHELTDLAVSLAREQAPAPIRSAVLARTPEELRARVATLREWARTGVERRIDAAAGVFLGRCTRVPRIGFLFPGQGSPSHRDGGALRRRFGIARSIFAATDELVPDGDDVFTGVAQPSIVRASLAACRVLDSLGIRASAAIGHSLGELTALAWAGALDDARTVHTAAVRGRAMGGVGGPPGAMVSLGVDPETARGLIEGTGIVIAGMNAEDNTVVSGSAEAVERVVARARERDVRATPLAVSHAFHSPMMLSAAHALDAHLATLDFAEMRETVVSTVTGAPLAPDTDLRGLLMRQLVEPVRFASAIGHLRAFDLLVEVGPGQVLSGLAARAVDVPCIATDAGGPSLTGLLAAIGAAWVVGASLERAALADGRFARPFDLGREPRFFASPCEAPAAAVDPADVEPVDEPADAWPETAALEAEPTTSAPDASETPPVADLDVGTLVRELVAARTELPIDAIHDEHHVLEDLHLNSISVGQLVAEAARRVGATPPGAPNELASATVGEIAVAVAALRDEAVSSPSTTRPVSRRDARPIGVAGVGSWVRPFAVRWAPRHLRRDVGNDGANAAGRWTVVADSGDRLATYLARAAVSWAGRGVLLVVPDGEAGDPTIERSFGRYLVETAHALGAEGVSQLVVVERRTSAAAFARAAHRERPSIDTLVVRVPDASVVSAAYVAAEVTAFPGGYVDARYDDDGRRRVPVLEALREGKESADPVLTPSDVVLVTGGGKGIAAEVGLALVKTYGVSLALLGRSDPRSDASLRENLERFDATGARVHYVSADVTSAEEVRRAVADATRVLGPITGIVHGAGRNEPRVMDALDEAAVAATLAPKLDGVRHVLAALDERALRLLVTFGSIIGRIGMEGEADYAVANDLLATLTERIAARLPSCRCHCIEWSAWSEVGMAERLGRVRALERRGVTCITPDQGVRALLDLLRRAEAPVTVVVTGRFGTADTVELGDRSLPLARFLERTLVHVPHVELVVEATLGGDTDPYLDDHVVSGDRLLPAVVGLEAMAQVACAAIGREDLEGFEDVELLRAVRVGEERVIIRVAALVTGADEVTVSLRSSETDDQMEHFRARCRFGSSPTSPESAIAIDDETPGERPGSRAGCESLDPDRDLYGSLLFQSGRFRRIDRYRSLSARRMSARMLPDGHHVWFGGFMPSDLVLGDAGARDACLHAIQACVPHVRILPVGVRSITVGRLPSDAPIEVRAREIRREGKTFVYDMEILDAGGRCIERWRELELRAVGPQAPGVWTTPLLETYVERRLEEIFEGGGITVRLADGAPTRELGAALALEATSAPVMHRRPDGRPVVPDGTSVSISHGGGVVIAIASADEVGCDVEPVTPRDDDAWRDLLGSRYALAHAIADALDEPLGASCTRVWSAVESLMKIGAPAGASLTVHSRQEDGWVILVGGAYRVATCVLERRGAAEPLALAVARREQR